MELIIALALFIPWRMSGCRCDRKTQSSRMMKIVIPGNFRHLSPDPLNLIVPIRLPSVSKSRCTKQASQNIPNQCPSCETRTSFESEEMSKIGYEALVVAQLTMWLPY